MKEKKSERRTGRKDDGGRGGEQRKRGGQLAAGTCEIVTLDRDSSQPRRTIARQTARCACKKGQIAGTTRARPACVDERPMTMGWDLSKREGWGGGMGGTQPESLNIIGEDCSNCQAVASPRLRQRGGGLNPLTVPTAVRLLPERLPPVLPRLPPVRSQPPPWLMVRALSLSTSPV
ncbi:Protein FAM19A5 [Liparis tanakae]|uniref:Protein FAM19A5 n=1 Tax=Liparis tanakae TaxID=230148 RepID=A0A4Z2HXN9_9TELE|nr:Protein FAM19A5 [Liparis tanakae]